MNPEDIELLYLTGMSRSVLETSEMVDDDDATPFDDEDYEDYENEGIFFDDELEDDEFSDDFGDEDLWDDE